MRQAVLSLILTSIGVSMLAAGAGAQEPGVHVDPDSPAGKEYDIPVQDARRTGNGGSNDSAGNPPGRFGDGISRQDEDDDASGGSSKSKSKSNKDNAGDSSKDESDIDTAPAAGSGGSDDGPTTANTAGSAGLLTGGILLAVLLIGGAVALMTRRAGPDAATDDA